MELDRALSQLSEIHAQVLRSEVFRGYRSAPMAVTGLLAFVAATAQERLWPPQDGLAFVGFWFLIACVGLSIHGVDVLMTLRSQDRRTFQASTLPVLAQFVPPVVVGAALALILVREGVDGTPLLPGLWALVFSLGVFASRPYLPRAVGWVGSFYLGAGVLLLATADSASLPSPWTMGLTFGLGQLAFAVVMHFQLERERDV